MQGRGLWGHKVLVPQTIDEETAWMSDCVTKIDATNIGVQHDLKDLLGDIAVASEEDMLSPEEI